MKDGSFAREGPCLTPPAELVHDNDTIYFAQLSLSRAVLCLGFSISAHLGQSV